MTAQSPRAVYREAWRADRAANRSPKTRFVLHWFRLCQRWRAERSPIARVIFVLIAAPYKVVTEWILGIEIPVSTRIGPGLRLRHGVGVVINPASTIGANVMLRQGVTIGNRRTIDDCPRIGDDVELGVGAVVIGDVHIGDGARIGPLAVVFRDVPAGAVVRSPSAETILRTDGYGGAE